MQKMKYWVSSLGIQKRHPFWTEKYFMPILMRFYFLWFDFSISLLNQKERKKPSCIYATQRFSSKHKVSNWLYGISSAKLLECILGKVTCKTSSVYDILLPVCQCSLIKIQVVWKYIMHFLIFRNKVNFITWSVECSFLHIQHWQWSMIQRSNYACIMVR